MRHYWLPLHLCTVPIAVVDAVDCRRQFSEGAGRPSPASRPCSSHKSIMSDPESGQTIAARAEQRSFLPSLLTSEPWVSKRVLVVRMRAEFPCDARLAPGNGRYHTRDSGEGSRRMAWSHQRRGMIRWRPFSYMAGRSLLRLSHHYWKRTDPPIQCECRIEAR
jgi:hypothetical protein